MHAYINSYLHTFYLLILTAHQRRESPAREQSLTQTHRDPQPESGRGSRTTDVAASEAIRATGASVCPLATAGRATAGRVVGP